MPDPVLLVEILSPGNRADTWSNVWTSTSIPTVIEVLILDSTRPMAQILRRAADGNCPEEPIAICDGTVALDSVGLGFSRSEVYGGKGL